VIIAQTVAFGLGAAVGADDAVELFDVLIGGRHGYRSLEFWLESSGRALDVVGRLNVKYL
jgi:hypothetical protein